MCIDWFCDGCNAQLNTQPGFTTSGGSWTCAECGYVNDVTDSNVIGDDFIGTVFEGEKDDGTIERVRFTKTREVHEWEEPDGTKTRIWRRR